MLFKDITFFKLACVFSKVALVSAACATAFSAEALAVASFAFARVASAAVRALVATDNLIEEEIHEKITLPRLYATIAARIVGIVPNEVCILSNICINTVPIFTISFIKLESNRSIHIVCNALVN